MDTNPIKWLALVAAFTAATLEASGVPVSERAKHIISCADGYGFGCRR